MHVVWANSPPSALQLSVICLAMYCGCSQPKVTLPETFPVTGAVIDKAGQPMTTGTVQFVSATDQDIQALGEVQTDGSFSLTTFFKAGSKSGAVPGPHEVTYLPGGRDINPYYFETTYEVEPDQNHFDLQCSSR